MRHGPRSGLMLHSLCAGLTRASIKKRKLFPRPWIARSSPAMTSPYVDSTRCGRLSTPLPLWERVAPRVARRRVSGLSQQTRSRCPLREPLIRRFAPPSPTRGEGRQRALLQIVPTASSRRASPGSRRTSPPAWRCRAGSGSPCGMAPGCGCRQSAQTRSRCCAAQPDI